MCVVVFYHNLFSRFKWKYKGSNIRSVVQFRHCLYVRPPFHSKRTALLLSWSPMFRGQNLLRESRSFTTSSQLPFYFLVLPFYFSIPTFIYLFHILNIFYNSSNFHFSTLIPHDSENILFLFRGGSYCVIFSIFINRVYISSFYSFFQFLSIFTVALLLAINTNCMR